MSFLKTCYNDYRKEVGSVDILTQLNNAMSYIETHIDDDLALTDVSSVTAYSPYHFGRLFYYIADMPLSEYIRKRKLSLAAMKLQNGSNKVIDIAVLTATTVRTVLPVRLQNSTALHHQTPDNRV